ncbi:hypothetical protein [Dyadobacter psychrotolerans]|uniref:Uncharacterized protein n=1 Tax=Dyadobacter psychrotolerans TaxID=2541721 RepID=A0A4R5DU87_9BACT|nr:hypothetical protein [Dyadobacter psychrotolerans]TDE18052.1 hypothetical protein E0F88_00415 [Dyadobacter psychrotolerans]
MIEKQNTLEWLDFIITIAIDADESEVNTLNAAQYEHITEKIYERKQNYISFLNHQRLNLLGRRKIGHLVKAHHGSLLILLDHAAHARTRINPLNTLTEDALHQILSCVYELLSFIQSSFGEYLDLDERAPDAYLAEFDRHHQHRITTVKKQLTSKSADPNLVAILLGTLSTAAGSGELQPPSFRTIFYQRELLYGLEQMLWNGPQSKIDDALVELLVYLNFNCRPFMNYYTQHLASRIDRVEPAKEKIHQLLLHYKQFNQMHRKPGVRLSQADYDIKKFVSNWFTQEIVFLKEQSQSNVSLTEQPAFTKSKPKPETFKVLVLLSVDQIGLFLRAIDSLRIVKARSMNAVFEAIVPFLSTPRKAEISWDSMRSKSYSFEEKDKQTVIKLLESVITWIKEY